MSDEINELRQQIAVLEERIKTMEANVAKEHAKGETAIERLRADNTNAIERLRTDMAQQSKDTERQIKNMIIVTVGAIGVGVAIISAVVTINANSTLAPATVSYQPPAASVLSTPN